MTFGYISARKAKIDKAFAWTWFVIAAFLTGVVIGPLGLGWIDIAGAWGLLGGGLLVAVAADRIGKMF